ncbi:hypothetical protein AB1N83_002578 [Pleurotus pulmonarius]
MGPVESGLPKMVKTQPQLMCLVIAFRTTLRIASISASRGLRFSYNGNQYSRKLRLTCVDGTDNDYTTFGSERSGLWTPPFIDGCTRVLSTSDRKKEGADLRCLPCMDQEPWDIYEGCYPRSALCLTLTSAPAALNLKGTFKWLWSSFTLFNSHSSDIASFSSAPRRVAPLLIPKTN